MEAKELRIGNYVHYHIVDELDERKEWNEINEVDIDDIYTVLIGKADDLSPIPLTEECLLKLGFDYNSESENNQFYCEIFRDDEKDITNYLSVNFDEYGHLISIKIECTDARDCADHIVNVKYVHQLQNLYFALTGEELIFEKK